MALRLSEATLDRLPSRVLRPQYRRADLSPGIVHFGVGNFHRAHQAVYLDDLFNAGISRDWAIVGAGVLPSDAAMREKLRAQDLLTTVVEQDAGHALARVTAPMVDFLDPTDIKGMVLRLAEPAVRIVSLTITEGGYFLDAHGAFNAEHPNIVRDAAQPDRPGTVFGLMLAALARRRADGTQPFTVMSCDNIPGNGHVTQNALVGLAELFDRDLADWVAGAVAFPNSMVDRITPATTDRERETAAGQFGIADAWPVFCEPFRQWVMEDSFPLGRPELERAGVTFVEDVAPYELMKIRILNGGHAAIAYPAGLMDIHYVHEALEDDTIRKFLRKLEREEVIPSVPPVPEVDLDAYYRQIEGRFANPKIGDTIRRLCLDGSNRQPKFIVPTIAANLAAGRETRGLALVSALWCRYCLGKSDSGAPIAPNDPNWTMLQDRAMRAQSEPDAWLGMAEVYGPVGLSTTFRDAFAKALETVREVGARAALERYLAGAP